MIHSPPSVEELISSIQTEEEWRRFFELLFSSFNRMVLRRCKEILRDDEDARDASGDVWARIFTTLPALRGHEIRSFAAWIYQVTTHCCFDWLRNKGVRRDYLEVTAAEQRSLAVLGRLDAPIRRTAEENVHQNETRNVVRDALESLPDGERRTMVLRMLEDLSVAETADARGINEGTVKSQTCRGLKKLAKLLAAEAPETHSPRPPKGVKFGPPTAIVWAVEEFQKIKHVLQSIGPSERLIAAVQAADERELAQRCPRSPLLPFLRAITNSRADSAAFEWDVALACEMTQTELASTRYRFMLEVVAGDSELAEELSRLYERVAACMAK